MTRKISGIIVGYIIFVATSLAFFKLSGKNPHADPTSIFLVVTAIYGTVSSFVAGLVAQLISRTGNLKVNYVLAIVIAGFATFSFFKASGNYWTQILAVFLFAPASVLGGLFYIKRFYTINRL